MSVIVILPLRSYCSIDTIARKVDCSGLDASIRRLQWDDELSAGATWSVTDPLDLDDAPTAIAALPDGAQGVIDAWASAETY
jgi:hypothetical protein